MFSKNRNYGTYAEIDIVKKTIDKANAANILHILHSYNLNIDAHNNTVCCPFSFHKGGNERSSSFTFYAKTNSFFCYGCNTGGGPVEFVEAHSNYTLSKYSAALSIIDKYKTNQLNVSEKNSNSFYKIYIEFSHLVRNFIMKNKDNSQALNYAEKISAAFDDLRHRHTLEPEGLNKIYTALKNNLEDYK